ncbi:uncharacterized protein [Diadema setosum]|uniref:uncharacterized protein n=1 Tax=Diadema setosum TaxID=31175 RepID=UPI003B3B0F47
MVFNTRQRCWHFDRCGVESNALVSCACAKEAPDFDVQLPAFMDFSPKTISSTSTTGQHSITTESLFTTRDHTEPFNAIDAEITKTTTLAPTSVKSSLRTFTISNAAESSSTMKASSRLVLIATTSAGGACLLLVLFIVLLSLFYFVRKWKSSNGELDVIPVANSEASMQGASPGEVKKSAAASVGSNNPTLTESQDRGLDSSTKSSTNAANIITMKGSKFKGDPV